VARPTTRTAVSLIVVGCTVLSTGAALAAAPVSAAPSTAGTDLRLIAGTKAVVDHEGHSWAPDSPYASGGRVWTSARAVTGTTDSALYQTERFGMHGYAIPLPASGTYSVTLNEAETYWTKSNQRLFSVAAEGRTVANRVDIFSRVGRDKAYQLTFDVTVTDKTLNLDFTNIVNNAKIASLRIVAKTPVVVPPPPAPIGPVPSAVGTDVRMVAGTQAVVDHEGHSWAPDSPYARGGSLWTSPRAVTGTLDSALYATERFGVQGYAIPLPAAGTYTVTVNEAESYWTASGQRVFSVAAEGRTVADRVDIFSRVGRDKAYQLTFDVTVTDKTLNLDFTNIVDNAKVTSLRVVAKNPVAVVPPAPVLPPTPPPAPPAPVLPPTPPPAPPAPAAVITSPEQYGAGGNGVSDDTAALQRAFDSAPDGSTVLLSGTYAHSDVLHLRKAGLHVAGTGTLLATQESRSSVWIEADNVLLDGALTIATAHTSTRWGAWEQMGVRVLGHQGIVLRGVTVVGAAAAGIYVGDHAGGFVLDHDIVRDSRADGIHMTGGAHDGRVIAPTTVNTGDDGVAVVSYSADGLPCHDITVTSPRVLGTMWGRGLSVVGGTRIRETDIRVERSSAAAVYVGAEGSPWFTAAPQDVTVDGGVIVGANTDAGVDHGAVLVLGGANGPSPTDITIRGLAISDTRASATRDIGVITYGTAPVNVELDDMTISGGPRSAYQGNTPSSSFRTRRWVQNGVQLPDQG
jgi:uncharacterized membrane protein